MKKIVLLCLVLFAFSNSVVKSQTKISTINSTSGYAGLNGFQGQGFITFNVENTNTYPIFLNEIETFKGPINPNNNASFSLWYSTTSLAGDATILKPIWDSITTSLPTTLTAGYNKVFGDLGFIIPANTQYRFALISNDGIAFSGNAVGTCSPSLFAIGGVNLKLGDDLIGGQYVGAGGVMPLTYGVPRWFTGSITFSQANNCSGMPVGGTSIASTNQACYLSQFVLSLSGTTQALNITYQWDSSSNGLTWFPIAGANSRTLIKKQTATSTYRCNVTCGTNKATSTSVIVTTPNPVSGNYTINSANPTGGTNFNSFNDAVNHIACGINGPVKFTVTPGSGPYDEQVIIPEISGASATNTITFKGNGETLTAQATVTNKSILNLQGSDFVTIDSLNIDATQGNFAWGIVLTKGADNNIIKNCTITGNSISTSTNFLGIVINGSASNLNVDGNNGSNNTIEKNKIIGGFYSIYVLGDRNNATTNINNKIIDNQLLDFYNSAVYLTAQSSGLLVKNNEITRPSRTNTASVAMVNLGNNCYGALIEGNKIHNIFESMKTISVAFTGFLIATKGKTGAPNKVINNVIYNIENNGTYWGFYCINADTTDIYHNTVVFDDNIASNGFTSGIYINGVTNGLNFRNNIVSITRSGVKQKNAVVINNTQSNVTINNNAWYFNPSSGAGNSFGLLGQLQFATFTDWKLANGGAYDQQSIEGDPQFLGVTSGDLKPDNPSLNDIGVSLGVAKDILDVTRGASPDPGAIEFTAPPCVNPVSTGLIQSVISVCAGNNLSLGLNGNSIGSGQTYLWERSLNGTTGWTAIQPAITNSFASTSQNVKYYYRCGVKCGSGNITYTPTQLITTPALLSGTFTINAGAPSSATNFQTFTEAFSYIACGINGPVTFNVAPNSGPYQEKVIIPEITGTSNINKITINGNGNTIQYVAPNSGDRVALHLKGTDFMVIDSLIIDVSGSTIAGWGVLLSNKADSNVIKRCTVNNNSLSTSSNYVCYLINGSNYSINGTGNNGNGNQFLNCTANGGYYGFYFVGNNSSNIQNNNNKVKNCIVKDFTAYGVYAFSQSNGLEISNCDFSRPDRTTTTFATYGIYVAGLSSSNVLVYNNRIHNLFDQMPTNKTASTGIFISADAKSGSENRIYNNVMYNYNNDGPAYGLYNNGADSCLIYHNTIVMDDQNTNIGGCYGLMHTAGVFGSSFKNNIVHITRSGTGTKRCIYFSTATTLCESNNNVLYLSSTSGTNNNVGQWGQTPFTSLMAWQGANNNAYDQQSQSFDAGFSNPTPSDFLPTNPLINGIGANLGLTVDINNNARTSSPDPGAFEVNISACANPPTPGVSIASNLNVCPSVNFTLNVSGNTIGQGQTFLWERNPTLAATGWTTVGLTTITPTRIASQIATNYYRCKMICSGGTEVYSAPVKITTPTSISGSFTVNNTAPNSATNFQSFTDALNFISCGGMGGPIDLIAVPGTGPYLEKIYIPQILGSSATNTLNIRGNGVTLLFTTNDINNKSAVTLDGADYTTIDGLVIDVTKGSYGWGVSLTNQADFNVIKNCTINTNADLTTNNFNGIVVTGATNSLTTNGNNANENVFENNTINGGYYGIYLYGNSNNITGSQNFNNTLRNNTIKDFYSYGIYTNYQAVGLIISKNDISRPNRINSTQAAGIYIASGSMGMLIEKNKVHGMFDAMQSNTSAFNGIYVGAKGKPNFPNKIFNNAIYDINSNGNTYGIYNSNGDTMLAYHNTIVFDNTNGAGSGSIIGINQNGLAKGVEIYNNVISITRTSNGIKRCLLFNTLTSDVKSKRNILFLNSTGLTNAIGTFGTLNYNTLAAWQAVNNFDSFSVDLNPNFKDPVVGDFSITNTLCRNLGKTIGGITTDINDSARNPNTPDVGAYEFILPPLPVKFTDLIGYKVNSTNMLKWSSLTEINNTGFEVLKSNDGKTFSSIGFVNTKAINGNSTIKLDYSFIDEKPNNISYYRIKQLDKDGRYSYSNIVVIQNSGQYVTVKVYPNPTKNIVNIQLDKDIANTQINILDVYGKQVLATTTNKQMNTINFSSFAKGIYFISISNNEIKKVVKILVE